MNSEIIAFDTLGLSPEILETIRKRGFSSASEIQGKAIPIILNSEHDIVGIAQTGTGKTAAFGLPLIEKIASREGSVQCIVLTPTRELAIQVAKEIDSFKGSKQIKTLPVYGGQDIAVQIRDLKRGVDIVVGTPGRVQDMMRRKVLDISSVKYFILDEADEMLKMGFIDEIELILQETPEKKRVFLFSATIPPRIQNLAKKYMKNQVVLEVKGKESKRDNIQQVYYRVRRSDKLDVIKNIIELADDFHGIIFCQTKVIVNEISDALKKEKLDVDCIHGDINQSGRERILAQFKAKKINILIATDVAARGIDVNDLTHVINYSLPKEVDSYVHRIGRTGRAGKQGIAITFIDSREEHKIRRLEKETGNKIPEGELPSREKVAIKKQERLIYELEDIITTKDTSFYSHVSKELVKAFGDTAVISALLFQINGSGKVEPPKERYDHDTYRATHKGPRTLRTLGRSDRKSYTDGKNRATRRDAVKRTDGPFGEKSEKKSFKKSSDGYKGFGKKKTGGFKKRK